MMSMQRGVVSLERIAYLLNLPDGHEHGLSCLLSGNFTYGVEQALETTIAISAKHNKPCVLCCPDVHSLCLVVVLCCIAFVLRRKSERLSTLVLLDTTRAQRMRMGEKYELLNRWKHAVSEETRAFNSTANQAAMKLQMAEVGVSRR